MQVIKTRYRDGSDFVAHYQTTFPDGGIFFPTRASVEAGTNVAVEVRFPGLPNRVVLRGVIAWRRPGRHSVGLRAGLGIAFLPEEAARRDYLLRLARGETDTQRFHRKFRRFPIRAPMQWRPKTALVLAGGTLADIGPGGAYITDAQTAPVPGSDVVLSIQPPGAQAPIDVEGRVVWVRGNTPPVGFGVQFKIRDVGGLRRLKEVVRRLEQGV